MSMRDKWVTCLLCCTRVTGCTPTQLHRLTLHLQQEHKVFYRVELLLKMHLMTEQQLLVLRDFSIDGVNSATLEELLIDDVENHENSVFTMEEIEQNTLPVNSNGLYLEGGSNFYKEKEVRKEYQELKNEYNKDIEEFIKSLPRKITYHSRFDNVANNLDNVANNLDETLNLELSVDAKLKTAKPKSNQVVCKICNKTLSRGSLKKHMEVIHSGLKFPCDECSQEFDSKRDLWVHKKKVHTVKAKKEKLSRIKSDKSSAGENSMDSSYQSDVLNETIDETDIKNERFNRATSFQFNFGESSRDSFLLGDGGFDDADEIDDVVY